MATSSTFFSIFLPGNSFLFTVCKLTQLALKTRLLSFYKRTELVAAIYSSRPRTNYIVLPMQGSQRCLMSLICSWPGPDLAGCSLTARTLTSGKVGIFGWYCAPSETQIARTSTLLCYKHCCKQNTKHKTLPGIQNTSQNPKTLARIQNTSQNPKSKTLLRIQNTSRIWRIKVVVV